MTNVVVFGFDAAESSQIRRIHSFIDAGYDLTAFTMRRGNMNPGFVPTWRNVHLSDVENERIRRRLWPLLRSLWKIARNREILRRADLLVARNCDLLLLAHAARLIALCRGLPIVYECLDIHARFTAGSTIGHALRFLERRLLRRTELLVISSPGFAERYFEPIQHYRGRTHLLENKVWFGGGAPARRRSASNVAGGRPWVVGWVGSLRCEPSFRLLLETARRMDGRVRIEMHGQIHSHVLPDFERRIGDVPNISYHGAYRYLEGLETVYARCDVVWAQDLWQAGANSDWLLPNRIYEASYFGCLSIALAATETGRKIAAENLGYVVPVTSAEALAALLESLEPTEVERRRAALLMQDPARFVSDPADIHALVAKALAERVQPRRRFAEGVDRGSRDVFGPVKDWRRRLMRS